MAESKKRIHLIAVGGSIMHNLAIDLKNQGHKVTGSDDEIFDPAKANLEKNDLLPESIGWNPDNISSDIDEVIVGMHAKADNPELLKARELKLSVYSFPEYVYNASQNKQRIVIAGSHGKTTITSMILSVLKFYKKNFDYLVGAHIDGFDRMVKITEDAPLIVIEGDEYPTAPFDKTPKFLHYNHHLGVVSGIAWDHINAYPSFDDYARTFDQFADNSPKGGTLVYSEDDDTTVIICGKERFDVNRDAYREHPHIVKNGVSYLKNGSEEVEVSFFGSHNMKNVNAALKVCKRLAITDEMFYEAIKHYKGASQRLELIKKTDRSILLKDFAHSPSKLNATISAVKEQYPNKKLFAFIELHTYSSLNKNFLPEYRGAMDKADEAVVFFNPDVVAHKQLPELKHEDFKEAFQRTDLTVVSDANTLANILDSKIQEEGVILVMTSGNFGNIPLNELADNLA